MLVYRTDLTAAERADFEHAIRASGKDPRSFAAELFETTLAETGATLRRVHVRMLGSCAAAQYEAGDDVKWTGKFALRLALGRFG